MKKKIAAALILGTMMIPTTIDTPQADASRAQYYWHNGVMDDSTVLNKYFKEAIKYNHFTYDGVNLNTNYRTFTRVMKDNHLPYKKVGTGKYKSYNSTFIFNLNNGKLTSSSKLKGIYFTFNDYDITTSQLKKVYGTPSKVNTINGGRTYIYKGHVGTTNKFDFVKIKGKYRLIGFITSK